MSNQNLELLTVSIQRPYQPVLYVSTVYIPPTANIKLAMDSLDEVANVILNAKSDWVLGGDLNTDLLDTKNNTKQKALANFVSSNQLNQLIKQPTRTTERSSTLIDHIYTNLDHNYTKAGLIKYGVNIYYYKKTHGYTTERNVHLSYTDRIYP